jgi:hypothetical protein
MGVIVGHQFRDGTFLHKYERENGLSARKAACSEPEMSENQDDKNKKVNLYVVYYFIQTPSSK